MSSKSRRKARRVRLALRALVQAWCNPYNQVLHRASMVRRAEMVALYGNDNVRKMYRHHLSVTKCAHGKFTVVRTK